MNEVFHFKKILTNKIYKSNSWFIEKLLIKKHKNLIAIDEAGKGALAGPLAIGALYLDKSSLNIVEKKKIVFYDSKIISFQERERYRKMIEKLGLKFKVIFVSNKKIDKIGIKKSFVYGVKRMLKYFQANAVVIDGPRLKEFSEDKNFYFFIKGDSFLPSLGAASILAKTRRDRFMINLGKKYSQYLFELHKGYGTKTHFKLIKKYGPSKYHRITFLKADF